MFHLTRLYRALTGDTMGRALTRMRIERAAQALASSRSISAIALEVGFRTPSSLAKAFRAALGMSPTAFRAASASARRKALRALEVSPPVAPAYALSKPRYKRAEDMHVVYCRERGPYSAISAPLAWAQLELRIGATPLVACQRIGASWGDSDSVDQTAPPFGGAAGRGQAPVVDELRYDAGVIVGALATAPPGTALALWPGGAFIVFDYRGDYRFIEDAFREIFAAPRFRKRRGPCLELYRNDPGSTELGRLHTELWIPIEENRHA